MMEQQSRLSTELRRWIDMLAVVLLCRPNGEAWRGSCESAEAGKAVIAP